MLRMVKEIFILFYWLQLIRAKNMSLSTGLTHNDIILFCLFNEGINWFPIYKDKPVIETVVNGSTNGNYQQIDYIINTEQLFVKQYNTIMASKLYFEDNILKTHSIQVLFNSSRIDCYTTDWITNVIYYANTLEGNIIAVNISETDMREMIVNVTKGSVGDIQVDPVARFLFYTQFNKGSNDGEVIRTYLDGSGPLILSKNLLLISPTNIAMDYTNKQLYILDQLKYELIRCDYYGNYQIVKKGSYGEFYFARNLDFIDNTIFWTFANIIMSNEKGSLSSDSNQLINMFLSTNIECLTVLSHKRKPIGKNNCENSHCNGLCLPSNIGFQCFTEGNNDIENIIPGFNTSTKARFDIDMNTNNSDIIDSTLKYTNMTDSTQYAFITRDVIEKEISLNNNLAIILILLIVIIIILLFIVYRNRDYRKFHNKDWIRYLNNNNMDPIPQQVPGHESEQL